MNPRPGQRLFAVAALGALAAAVVLQVTRDRWYPRREREIARLLYVRSGPAIKRLSLEYDAVAADVYWIRAIQHYGGDRLGSDQNLSKYQLLYPLLDITTTLDPYFKIAYRFGAIFLSEASPGGPGRPDQAVALLRKAIAAQPGNWQYYHDIAFVYYWHVRDYHSAAEWFQRAADQPSAPNWLRPLAASMLTQGEDRTSARFLWRQLLTADQEWLRGTAKRSLMQLDAMDWMDRLATIVRSNPPGPDEKYSWVALIRRGVLRGIPGDPTGTAFELDPVTGRITVSKQSPLFPMPDTSRIPKT